MKNDKELQLMDLAAWARSKTHGSPDVETDARRQWFVTPRNQLLEISICELTRDGGTFGGEALVLAGGGTEAAIVAREFSVGDTLPWGRPIVLKTDEKGKPIPCLALVVASYRGD